MTRSHANQAHQHGPECGHLGVRHEGHVDYLNQGHLEHQEAATITEHRRCGQQGGPQRGQEPNPFPSDG